MGLVQKTKRLLSQAFVIIGNLSFLALLSCQAIQTQSASSACEDNTAQFIVYDGAIKRVCGCSGVGEAVFTQSGSLTCTVSVGTTIYFYFVGITSSHQIQIQNHSSTPVIDPTSSVKTAAIVLNATNTSGGWAVTDLATAISWGTITVTP